MLRTIQKFITSFFHGSTALEGQSILIIEITWSYSRHSTLGGNPPDYWSYRRSDLYLITHNTHKRQRFPTDGIRIHNPNKRASTDPCLRTDDYRAHGLLWISAFIFMLDLMETWSYFAPNEEFYNVVSELYFGKPIKASHVTGVLYSLFYTRHIIKFLNLSRL